MITLNIKSIFDINLKELKNIISFLKGENFNKQDVMINSFTPLIFGEVDNFILDSEDINNMYDYGVFRFEDFFVDAIAHNQKVYIKKYEELNPKLKEKIMHYGVEINVNPFSFDREVNLQNIDTNDMSTILELLGESHLTNPKYLLGQSIVKISIHGSKMTINNSKELNINLNELLDNLEFAFSSSLVSKFDLNSEVLPCVYSNEMLFDYIDPRKEVALDNFLKNLVEYKYRVFKAISNVNWFQYSNVDEKLRTILNEHNYVTLSDIKKMIGK